MNFTNQSHLEILIALLENKVEFIIVGGYAVIFHGYIRTTGDMDIWLNPSEGNKLLLLDTFSKLNFDPEGIEGLRNLDFSNVIVFHIGEEPDRIDFLSQIKGLDFEKAYGQRQNLKYNEHQIPFLHLDDLILNKMLSDRLKDRADVEQLAKINTHR